MPRLRHRIALILFVFPLLALSQEDQSAKQIQWVGDWEQAFKQAKADNKPVMVCINSIDNEVANNRAAKRTYRDAAFVAATREFVMVIVSIRAHRASGECPRFGVVTCQQHHDCWKELRARHGETFANKAEKGKMISPQHAWFRPDGTLLRRKEYELTKPELLQRMRAVLKDVQGKQDPQGENGANPDGTEPGEAGPKPDDAAGDDRLKPLTEQDTAELVRAQKAGAANKETRRAALANLMATEKVAVHGALVDLLKATKADVKCDIIRALGEGQVIDALDALHGLLAKDRDSTVRSFCAVAIEDFGRPESIPFLIKRATKESDTTARKNVLRALGVCGGAAKDKKAAQVLLKKITGDKQILVRKHAGLACAHFKGEEASKLVLKRLEKLALKIKDDTVRSGVVYALAHIGNVETTLPVFQKLKDRFTKNENNWRDRWRATFMRAAIKMVKGEGGGFGGRTGRFLFEEDRNDPARQ